MEPTPEDKMQVIGDRLWPYVSLLLFLPTPESRNDQVLASATISFIDTGSAQLAVTCAHVYSEFIEIKHTYPDAALAISGRNGTPPSLLLDPQPIELVASSVYDVVAIRLSDPESVLQAGKKFINGESWPPSPVAAGERVAFVGYPGIHRMPSDRGLEAFPSVFCEFATSVNDRNILIVDEYNSRVAYQGAPNIKPLNDLRGMSGSLLCAISDRVEIRPVGIVYEVSHETRREGYRSSIFSTHLKYLKADGTIDHLALPY